MTEEVATISAQAQLRRGQQISHMSRAEIKELAKTILQLSNEHDIDVLETIVTARKITLLWQEVENLAQTVGINSIQRYEKQTTSLLGVELQVVEMGVKYDYTGDPVWKRHKADETEAANKRKAQEKFLRTLPLNGMVVADKETGESYEAYRPSRSASDSIKATID